MSLCIYKCYLACTVISSSVSSIFRHIWVLFKSILTDIQNLVYPWHTLIPKHIQAPRYIHNTILNIFHKNSILDVWYSSECASLLKMLYFTVSLTLYLRHILAFSRFIQPYLFLLRYIKNPGILKNILLQRYSGIF